VRGLERGTHREGVRKRESERERKREVGDLTRGEKTFFF